ncbi:hypothetical protein MAR_028291 [Mya arenaria]|uniref:Ribosomal protein L21 n=1 Tax=Mya arenaria TaxID=6604 RepID=A0ABY7DG75_MYAAR|nr:hypothetical protein MAR_028291 [Mya arenaria]
MTARKLNPFETYHRRSGKNHTARHIIVKDDTLLCEGAHRTLTGDHLSVGRRAQVESPKSGLLGHGVSQLHGVRVHIRTVKLFPESPQHI